jgi:probable rRNA maturation factor
MNRVDITFEDGTQSPEEGGIDPLIAEPLILDILERLECGNWDLSLVFCMDGYIRGLNARFRGKDEATDVLAFPLGENVEENGGIRHLPGDIVISLETLQENARNFQVCPDEELRRLLIHGILHLKGMDHETNNADIEPMLLLQEKLVAEFCGRRVLP